MPRRTSGRPGQGGSRPGGRFAPRAPSRPWVRGVAGFVLTELLLVLGLVSVAVGVAVPRISTGQSALQARAAVQYLVGRIMLARAQAVQMGAAVGLRFEMVGGRGARDAGVRIGTYVDGDGDGVRSEDITTGMDRVLEPAEPLLARFPRVRFGLATGVPPVGGRATSEGTVRGVRLGGRDLLTMTPLGTATSGTIYLGSDGGAQYAVRIFGATARVTVLRFDARTADWERR